MPEEVLGETARRVESSRDSLAGAGWECRFGPGTYLQFAPEGEKSFSWLSPKTLWQARNELVARHLANPTNERRQV